MIISTVTGVHENSFFKHQFKSLFKIISEMYEKIIVICLGFISYVNRLTRALK